MMQLEKPLLQQAREVRIALALTIGLGTLAGFTLVAMARLLSRVVAGVFLEGQTLHEVHPLLFIFLAFSLANAGLTWGSELAAVWAAGRVKRLLRRRLMEHIFTLGPAYTHGEQSGELTNTMVEGVEALQPYFSQYLPQLAKAVLVPLTILVFVFPIDLISGIVLLLTAPLIPLFMTLIGDAAERLTKRQWTTLSRMSAHFLDVLQGLSTLKVLGRSRDQAETIAEVSDRFRRTTLGVLRVTFLSALVMEMLSTVSTAVVAVEVGLRLLYGRLAFEQALFVLILAPEFYLPLRILGARFHAGMSGTAAAKRIFQVLDTPSPLGPLAPKRHFAPPPPRLDLSLEDVHFTYPQDHRSALRGVSFHIAHGQKVALVGPTGSGKTTIAYLLLRFLNPDQGRITVNGQPLSSLELSHWRSLLAWVPQEPHLFNASVLENVQLARPRAGLNEVKEACRRAQAHAFIQNLPEGYSTIIGERGTRLSAGQAQRIALARAFLKDAPFLILDEATANLDPKLEAQVQGSMRALLRGRTSLFIAHRLGTIQDADMIVILSQGRIIEAGRPDELPQRGGLYHDMLRAYGGSL